MGKPILGRHQPAQVRSIRKHHWKVVDSPDKAMIGRRFNNGEALSALKQGFYPSGTIVYVPVRKVNLLIYKSKAYVLTNEGDLLERDGQLIILDRETSRIRKEQPNEN